MAESLQNFIARVEERSEMSITDIPDGIEDDMMRGSIVCRSQHGVLIYVDFDYQDEDGCDIYSRAVLIRYSDKLPPASEEATGLFADIVD